MKRLAMLTALTAASLMFGSVPVSADVEREEFVEDTDGFIEEETEEPDGSYEAGSIAIDETNFPDAVFRSYVSDNFDTNGDGELSPSEIAEVREIEVPEAGISDLTGIECFTDLCGLVCYDNELTDLDLSYNTELSWLECDGNNLTKLDLSHNAEMAFMWCYGNSITILDISNNPDLIDVYENGTHYSEDGVDYYTLEDEDGSSYGDLCFDSAVMIIADPPAPEGSSNMFRLYNPNSGEHFYTSSSGERNHLIGLGWNYEGVGWIAPQTSNTPVYRLYNPNGGEHHYTTSPGERNHLIAAGWSDEGIGWYSDDAETVPLYRQYNPNAYANNHNYTTSLSENNWLVSIGWKPEGIGWYGK